MPTTQEALAEVLTLTHQLGERVELADKEQKSRGEELTSKTATIAAEFKSSTDAINTRINEIMDKLEQDRIAAARPPMHGGKEKKDAAAHAAFMKAIRHRVDSLNAEEKSYVVKEFMPAERKALYAADATTGGFFASTDFVNELIEYILLISPIRQIARKQTTSGERVQMPSLANDASAYWAAEQSTYTASTDPTVSMINIPVQEARGLLKVSQQNLEDSMFDLESLIKERLGKKFAQLEGTAFVTGNGAGKPRGFMNYPSKASSGYTGGSAGLNNVTDAVPYVLSGAAAGKINADDVLNVLMDLKADYDKNATYVFTRSTLNTVRLFKDSQNRPLWQPFAGSNLPSTIYDRPYVEVPDMPQIASGKQPIAVGDFSNYLIVDRISLNIQQLTELYAESGLVGFIARLRVGGDLLVPESFRTLQCN